MINRPWMSRFLAIIHFVLAPAIIAAVGSVALPHVGMYFFSAAMHFVAFILGFLVLRAVLRYSKIEATSRSGRLCFYAGLMACYPVAVLSHSVALFAPPTAFKSIAATNLLLASVPATPLVVLLVFGCCSLFLRS